MNEPLTAQQCLAWAFGSLGKGNYCGRDFWLAVAKRINAGERVTLDDIPRPKPINIGVVTLKMPT